jgi:polysaccharide export outer membrane protein
MVRKWMVLITIGLGVGLLAGCVSVGGKGGGASYSERKRFARSEEGRAAATSRAPVTESARKHEVPALVTRIRADELKQVKPEPSVTQDDTQRGAEKPNSGGLALTEGREQEPKVYQLKPNDMVGVYLRGIPQPEQIEDIVDESGYITLPYIDRVQAAGKTSSELEREIRKAYLDKQIYRNVTVNVVLPTQNYFIRGEVKRPGRFPLTSGVTVLQAVAAAGGYSEYANSRKVRVLRGGRHFMVDAREIEEQPEKDVEIEAGDVIIVPRSVF